MRAKKRITSVAAAITLSFVLGTGSAFAHDCVNAKKKDGAASVGAFDLRTLTFTPSDREHGAFVVVTDGVTAYDIFIHRTLPESARNAGPGDDQCDGKGVDSFMACMGWEPES